MVLLGDMDLASQTFAFYPAACPICVTTNQLPILTHVSFIVAQGLPCPNDLGQAHLTMYQTSCLVEALT